MPSVKTNRQTMKLKIKIKPARFKNVIPLSVPRFTPAAAPSILYIRPLFDRQGRLIPEPENRDKKQEEEMEEKEKPVQEEDQEQEGRVWIQKNKPCAKSEPSKSFEWLRPRVLWHLKVVATCFEFVGLPTGWAYDQLVWRGSPLREGG